MPKRESNAKKSIPHKFKFLLNANISRKISFYFSSEYSLDCKHISSFSNQSFTDQEVVNIAKKEQRVIITHDLDYGEIYYFKEQGQIGVIMLRLKDQTTNNVIMRLSDFFSSNQFTNLDLNHNLVVISEKTIRIFSPR